MTTAAVEVRRTRHLGRISLLLAGGALAVLALVSRLRARRRLDVGSVSDAWLAEHAVDRAGDVW